MHATATKGESSQDAAVSEATASLPIPNLAAEQTPLWAQAVAPIQAKLRINRPGDKYEQEADRVADQVMRRTGPIAAPVIREESADPERENQAFGVWRSALPSITPAPRAVIQRVPGDVTRVNHHLLTLFLSSYEGGPLVPLAATQAYLSNPPLLAMGARLRDRVLANQQGGNAPLTLEQFYQLALGITPHRGTALLLAHNVSKGFARGSAALNITRLDAPNYYRLFAAASLGTTDPGDWYHYFVISIPAYYFSAGAADTALPPEGDPNESFGTSMRRGLAVSFVDALRGGLRDRAIPASAGYDGWLAANAISFAEGGFWGHGQAEVLGESLVHLQGAMTGVEQAGQTVNQDWRWYVPISRGIGDAQHPDADLTLANYGRIQREGPTPFTYRIYDPQAQMVQQVNTTVPRPAADQSAPAPAPAPSTPAPSGSSGSSTGRGILRKAKENGQANGVGLPDGLTAVAGTVHGSSGRALDGSTRSYMETRFGRDFGDVRIHTDAQAAASAAAINARAYTVGRNIVFGAGEYRPIEQQGRRLIAHELVHTLQQRRISEQVSPLQRLPTAPGPDTIHDPLIDQYRRAHGYPPGGVDPATGNQVGPSDAELKYGGVLDRWLRQGATHAAVPAPVAVPTLTSVTGPFDHTRCGTVQPQMSAAEQAEVRGCIYHSRFVNHMHQSVANMRQISSPYVQGLAALYTNLLNKIRSAGQSQHPSETRPQTITLSNIRVAVSAATTVAVPSFTLLLEQRLGDNNGSWDGQRLNLNELSGSAVTDNQVDIERTMYHEGFHFLSSIVSSRNRAATGGPGSGQIVEPALDADWVRAYQSRFEAAVTPFYVEALQNRSTIAANQVNRRAALWAFMQWVKVADEILVRVEEEVYLKLRQGYGFTQGDLNALPQNWLVTAGYWPCTDITPGSMQAFLRSRRADIMANVLPLILEMQQHYLSLRPAR